MRAHLMRGQGPDRAIADAIDLLPRVRFSREIVEEDDTPDHASPTRAASLRGVQDDVSSAIEELRRVHG